MNPGDGSRTHRGWFLGRSKILAYTASDQMVERLIE
jgi:hypothetical protein